MYRSMFFAVALLVTAMVNLPSAAHAEAWDGSGFPEPSSNSYWDGSGFPEPSSNSYWDGSGFPEPSSNDKN